MDDDGVDEIVGASLLVMADSQNQVLFSFNIYYEMKEKNWRLLIKLNLAWRTYKKNILCTQ